MIIKVTDSDRETWEVDCDYWSSKENILLFWKEVGEEEEHVVFAIAREHFVMLVEVE